MTDMTPQDGEAVATDEDALFPELPISGPMQIVVLGLIVVALFLFGGEIIDFLT